MQIKDVRPASFVKQIRCDRCDRLAEVGDAELEFQEFVSINHQAGYASIFGDGNHVQVDLCQHCLKDVLGRWLRIDDPRAKSLRQFDPDRHGGEFPCTADASLQEPDDLQVQERMPLNEPQALRRRLSSLQAFFGHSARLYFAPLTGAVRGIRREYRRLEWAERQRLRRQAEFERRGREAIKRSIAAGDWIPAEEVIGKLRAKVDAARKRRVIGMLSGKLDVPANFDAPLPEEVLQDFEGRLTTDTKLTVTTRTKDDPGFVEALLNEAIELAANGEAELAKRVLRDLIAGTKR
jgi:hypothetical protein